jgi:hypothetical protein
VPSPGLDGCSRFTTSPAMADSAIAHSVLAASGDDHPEATDHGRHVTFRPHPFRSPHQAMASRVCLTTSQRSITLSSNKATRRDGMLYRTISQRQM